jgi:hypothetical protein
MFPPDPVETRRWMGRLLIAVIVGEGIWNFIVSMMNYVIVPWIGEVMGQSSGLPSSFTQRPYNYPDLFVSIIELCLAGLVAVGINAFFQRPQRVRVKIQKKAVAPATIAPLPQQPLSPVPQPQAAMPVAQPQPPAALPVAPKPVATPQGPAPVVNTAPVHSQATITRPIPASSVETRPIPVPLAPTPAPVVKPVPAAPPAPGATKPSTPPVPKKPKKVYYNSVGEPIEFDDED